MSLHIPIVYMWILVVFCQSLERPAIKVKYPPEKKRISVPVNLLTASKPFRTLAFMSSVCSAREVWETCFPFIDLSARLYSGAGWIQFCWESVSKHRHWRCLVICFDFLFFIWVCSSWNQEKCIRDLGLTKEKKTSWEITEVLTMPYSGLTDTKGLNSELN